MNTHMKLFYFIITFYLSLILPNEIVHGQSVSCSCNLDPTGMTMICTNVQSLIAYQQCMHEQLNVQPDLKLRRGGIITNLTITNHQLRSLSSGLLQFSYGHNNVYQLSDLRYLYVTHGTLRHIESGALGLIERALEYYDLSYNELGHIPRHENEQYSNLVKLSLSNNQIHRLTLSDSRAYPRLQQLDLSNNRLQYVDMLIVHHLKNLKHLFLNSNMLRTLANNITFPNNFHLKLSSNPLECDCRLRWLRNALNRVEYPIYHDEPQCEMPKALADKKITILRDEQFVCGPIISRPELTILTATTGEVATLRCDVYSDPAPDVWWTFQNKIIGKIISTSNEPDIRAGLYTIRFSCLSSSSESSPSTCLNKTTTLTISNIGTEHNGTYNCVAAIRNQGRSDNEYRSYELRVRRSSSITDSSFLLWTIGLFLILFLFIVMLLCICWVIRCHRSSRLQAERNKALLFDTNHHNGMLLTNGHLYKEKNEEQHSFVTNGSYDPYDMIDSRSQLGPPMYSEVRIVDSTPLRSVGGGSMSSSIPLHDTATLMRRHHPHDTYYDSYRSDRQLYEQVYRPSPMEPIIVDEFEDEMIFPTGYEENYEYREDIMKPNQAVDPRRQPKQHLTNHDRTNGTIILPPMSSQPPPVTVNGNHTSQQKLILTPNTKPSQQMVNSSSFDSNYKFDRSESQYAGLVESQL